MDDPFNDPFWRSLLCDVQLTDAVSEEPDVPVTGSDAVAPAGVAAPPAAWQDQPIRPCQRHIRVPQTTLTLGWAYVVDACGIVLKSAELQKQDVKIRHSDFAHRQHLHSKFWSQSCSMLPESNHSEHYPGSCAPTLQHLNLVMSCMSCHRPMNYSQHAAAYCTLVKHMKTRV